MNLLPDDGLGDLVRIGAGSVCSDLASGLTGIGDVGIFTTFTLPPDDVPRPADEEGTGCLRPLSDCGLDDTRGDLFSSLRPTSDKRLWHTDFGPVLEMAPAAVDELMLGGHAAEDCGPPRIAPS